MTNNLLTKQYEEPSVFIPENLLREARRQKRKIECNIPLICLLDPDGDLTSYLIQEDKATKSDCWACYHSTLYTCYIDGFEMGIIPCVVGSSYAVLVAEQLFVSGCILLISITSAGIITQPTNNKKFALITKAVRDEGTSYHYLPPEQAAMIPGNILTLLNHLPLNEDCPFFTAYSWTTDAPYRETQSAINIMRNQDVVCVEMEAAALYALSSAKKVNIICFAHLTNSMAQKEGDFEKGEKFGSLDSLDLIKYLLKIPQLIKAK